MKAQASFVPLHRFREHGETLAPFHTDIPLATALAVRGPFCAFPKPPPPSANQRDNWSMARTQALERYLLRISVSA